MSSCAITIPDFSLDYDPSIDIIVDLIISGDILDVLKFLGSQLLQDNIVSLDQLFTFILFTKTKSTTITILFPTTFIKSLFFAMGTLLKSLTHLYSLPKQYYSHSHTICYTNAFQLKKRGDTHSPCFLSLNHLQRHFSIFFPKKYKIEILFDLCNISKKVRKI